MPEGSARHGGMLVAEVLAQQGVQFLFTLTGGHISPILVGAQERRIRVLDVRDEATAVFAADAVSRLSGTTGVAAATAGPGLTNTITAVKNAQLAESPLVLLGGATATLLKGRGALQDIDHMALMKPHVKWAHGVSKVRDIVPALEKAFHIARSGVPGPVFVELPLDVLYQRPVVEEWYMAGGGGSKSWRGRLFEWYLTRHVDGLFAGAWDLPPRPARAALAPQAEVKDIAQVLDVLRRAERPVLLISNQAMLEPVKARALQAAVLKLGVPTFLSSMARGLLGRNELHIRHGRTRAMKEADVIILAGVPCDFRLNYGRKIPRAARLISVDRSKETLHKNCSPDQAVHGDPGAFLRHLAASWNVEQPQWSAWVDVLQQRDAARDVEIAAEAEEETDYVNPLFLCREIEQAAAENSIFVGDGGDFVATASYILRPRSPLSWLDPGPFGTLGSGAGFALGASLVRPGAEVWLLYGDGAAGYSLAEFDTFSRHGVPVIAVVGTDASWAQIARDQGRLLGSLVGTELGRTDYHIVAAGYGGEGIRVARQEELPAALEQAKATARAGKPVLVNVFIGKTGFREGSIAV